jgi:hypothetical protein
MTPRSEATDEDEYRGSKKQDVAARVDHVFEAKRFQRVRQCQNDERDSEPAENPVDAGRELANIRHFPDEEARGCSAQRHRDVPRIVLERRGQGQHRPVEAFARQKRDVKRLQRDERGVEDEHLVREHQPDQKRAEGESE